MSSSIDAKSKVIQTAMDDCKGWDTCKDYVADGATFACRSDTFRDIQTVQAYVEWCENLAKPCPNSTYNVKFTGCDVANKTVIYVCAYHCSNTGPGGPVDPPTGKSANSDYVYIMKFNDQFKLESMTKVWKDAFCLRKLGWM